MEQKQVIGTELLDGQGLGNQLFCYVTTRCIAQKLGADFSILNREILANNIHSQKGMYFMDLDCGQELQKSDFSNIYHEKEDRIFMGNSRHDRKKGCYVSGTDQGMLDLDGNTLLYGNMQAQDYFREYKDEIKKWLAVYPEYDHREYSKENLCIINIRGGEYAGEGCLFLRRKYWMDAMKHMRQERSDMEFVVITDDLVAANRILPEVKAYHFDLAGDYTIIKNARYLILSNSTFAFFPAYTSETAKKIIAPKYWARHNVSDGYWSSEQNIYDEFEYMDRKGKLWTAEECRKELVQYKKKSAKYRRINQPLNKTQLIFSVMKERKIWFCFMAGRVFRSLRKRISGKCKTVK